MTIATCDLEASRICTGCDHGRHDDCARNVRCRTTGDVRPCRCCGKWLL